MQPQTQITFHGIDHSDAVEKKIREKSSNLAKFYNHITDCRVVVEAQHHRHHKGELYHIRIVIRVPEKDIVISHQGDSNHAHEDIYVAIRDAFDAAKRRLEDYARIRRGDVKRHHTKLDIIDGELQNDGS